MANHSTEALSPSSVRACSPPLASNIASSRAYSQHELPLDMARKRCPMKWSSLQSAIVLQLKPQCCASSCTRRSLAHQAASFTSNGCCRQATYLHCQQLPKRLVFLPNDFSMAPRWAYIIIVSLLAVHIFFLLNSLKVLLAPQMLSTKSETQLKRLREQLLKL
jgi:hypothetical protein